MKFLFNLKDISQLERKKMLERLNSDDRNEIGEVILIALDKADDYKKSVLIANAFRGLIEEKINYSTFKRLMWAIQNINLQLLPELLNIYDKEDNEYGISTYDKLKKNNVFLPQSEELQMLSLCGLLSIHFRHSQDKADASLGGYSVNYLGEIFCQICVRRQNSEFSKKGQYVYNDGMNERWKLEKIEIKPN